MPYRGHFSIGADNIMEVAHANSLIPSENSPSELGDNVNREHVSLTPLAFQDKHTGTASGSITIGGTNIVAGDIVNVQLRNSAGGGLVTPSYTVTAADAALATLALKLAAVATGLTAAINASTANGTYLAPTTSSGPVITLTALTTGSAQLAISYLPSATPGTAGHATASPVVSTTMSPQNPNLHVPTQDGQISFTAYPGAPPQFVSFGVNEPVILGAQGFALANQSITFSY